MDNKYSVSLILFVSHLKRKVRPSDCISAKGEISSPLKKQFESTQVPYKNRTHCGVFLFLENGIIMSGLFKFRNSWLSRNVKVQIRYTLSRTRQNRRIKLLYIGAISVY